MLLTLSLLLVLQIIFCDKHNHSSLKQIHMKKVILMEQILDKNPSMKLLLLFSAALLFYKSGS